MCSPLTLVGKMNIHYLPSVSLPQQRLPLNYLRRIFFSVCTLSLLYLGLPWWLSGKESTCNAGDADLVLGSRRSPGGGNGNPLQYSCLENPMRRGAWWATVHRVAQSRTRLKWLSNSSERQGKWHSIGSHSSHNIFYLPPQLGSLFIYHLYS